MGFAISPATLSQAKPFHGAFYLIEFVAQFNSDDYAQQF
jgi:hypothetical protein